MKSPCTFFLNLSTINAFHVWKYICVPTSQEVF